MLKTLTKSGEYTHLFIILLMMTFYYFTPDINFKSLTHYPDAAPVGKWLQSQLTLLGHYTRLINIILIISIAIYTNKIAVSADITSRQSYISASIIAVLMLFSPSSTWYTGSLVVMLLLVFALSNIMSLFGKQYPFLNVLNASMAISISSMVLPQAMFFLVFIWFAFFTFSVNSWREWVISIIGLVLPYIYMVFAFFWNNNIEYLLNVYKAFFLDLGVRYQVPEPLQLATLAFMMVLFIIAAMHFTSEASDKIISIRKKMWITFQFSLICLVIIVLGGEFVFLLIPLIYIPLTIMLGYSIHNMKRSRHYDVLMILLIVSILINRFAF